MPLVLACFGPWSWVTGGVPNSGLSLKLCFPWRPATNTVLLLFFLVIACVLLFDSTSDEYTV